MNYQSMIQKTINDNTRLDKTQDIDILTWVDPVIVVSWWLFFKCKHGSCNRRKKAFFVSRVILLVVRAVSMSTLVKERGLVMVIHHHHSWCLLVVYLFLRTLNSFSIHSPSSTYIPIQNGSSFVITDDCTFTCRTKLRIFYHQSSTGTT